MTAIVLEFPRTPPPDLDELATATRGAIATWQRRLYVRGNPGWVCIAGSHHADTYAQWVDQLGPDAVILREGI